MTDPFRDFRYADEQPDPIRKLPLLYGVLLSIPLWGLIIAAIFSVVVRMVLIALAVALLASVLPDRWWLLSNTMLLGALALVIVGVVLAIDRWF